MSTFWILAALLTVIALLFVLPPLLRSRRTTHVNRNDLNTEVIKDQLAELRADLETGRLDENAYNAARHDLQRELLDDVDENSTARVDDTPRGRWIAAVLLVMIPAVSIPLYQALGQQDIIQRLAEGPGAAKAPGQQHSLEEMVEKLAERMRQDPENVEGWIMLGRSYASMNRYDDALAAYASAYQLDRDNPALMSDYADIMVTANGGTFTDEAGALLDKALAMDPQDIKTLWLSGHWKNQQGDYRGAIEHWQRAVALFPAGNENIAIINQQIQQAKIQLGEDVTGMDEPQAQTTSAAAGGSRIQVSVSLDPALADKASPDDTVFIFARASQGPKMPLAIVRKQVRDLPLTVTLDDSMAMAPTMVLSKFPTVTVGARISKSGQAIARSGDMQGIKDPVTVNKQESVEIVIGELVP